MNWLVFHIVSGHAFFTGVLLVMLAAFASNSSKPLVKRITVISFLIGSIAIAISSTPIPYWYYAVALVVSIAWMISGFVKQWRRWTSFTVIAIWLVAVAIEIPYHLLPTLQPSSSRSITVIGDSVTAGIEEDDKSETWTHIIAKQHHLSVQDFSHVGETASSALKRAKKYPITSSVVFLEIGGNDLLGSTTSQKFSHDLDALLEHVSSDERQVIMFELPLPPFYHEYGRIQRTLAAKHNVSLIPKRVFFFIIASNGSTLDSIHLSQTGHKQMASTVWNIIEGAFSKE